MGTFNVNGKMPSQDLASWVAGRSVKKIDEIREDQDVGISTPSLKRLSHLSLGDSATTNSSFYLVSVSYGSSLIRLFHHYSRGIGTVRNTVNKYASDHLIHVVDTRCHRR